MSAFWDTSAIIRICVPGQASREAKHLVREHSAVIWWCAPVEVRSALERLRISGSISPAAHLASKHRLDELMSAWREIQPSDAVRDLACVQLERFRLRAFDALHLAAALVWCKQKPREKLFVCNDATLAESASEAGFTVLEA